MVMHAPCFYAEWVRRAMGRGLCGAVGTHIHFARGEALLGACEETLPPSGSHRAGKKHGRNYTTPKTNLALVNVRKREKKALNVKAEYVLKYRLFIEDRGPPLH